MWSVHPQWAALTSLNGSVKSLNRLPKSQPQWSTVFVRKSQKKKILCKQPNKNVALPHIPPHPLWRWKEEEDATVNPESSRSQLRAPAFLFFIPQITAPLLPCLLLSDATWKRCCCLWTICFDFWFLLSSCDSLEVRGGGRGRSCGVGEDRGTDIGMPQAASLFSLLLPLVGCGECHRAEP